MEHLIKLADRMIPNADSPTWYFAMLIVTLLVGILGWRYLGVSQKKEEPKAKHSQPGEAIHCKRHDDRVHELQTQVENIVSETNRTIRGIQSDINNQALENEKAYHHMWKEMMEDLRNEFDSRDTRIEKMMDQKLSSFKDGLVTQMTATFRPFAENITRELISKING